MTYEKSRIKFNTLNTFNNVTVREDSDNFYVDFNTGLGEGIYPKADWTLEKSIKDQENIYKENK